jgi:hypothetical protein
MRLLGASLLLWTLAASAQNLDKFRPLDELWPTPNAYRTASGAPGPAYWQQQADYDIDAALDETSHRITGSERITYHNNSPDSLTYLWIQLDQNNFDPKSTRRLSDTVIKSDRFPSLVQGEIGIKSLETILNSGDFDGGFRITRVAGDDGPPLPHVMNETMMRVDLPQPLRSGQATGLIIEWNYLVTDSRTVGAMRSGREFFKKDGNWLYEIAQWYPRLAVYDDVNGWQIKHFVSSEFALEFGDFKVRITVPDDHIVAATGELINPGDVLTPAQVDRLAKARTADKPAYVVTPEEATANESHKPAGTKTWTFEAKNVRDFGWATSRKFIWDAQGHWTGDHCVMAMSFWPKEAEPLWSQYSTQSVLQTLDVYGRVAFPMPYPTMISVNGPVGGMEYPMITFNGARPEEDGTYGERTKYGLISVILHEVGHSWFPMIVNSDERQWTWMDEGINTFVQFLAEQAWQEKFPSTRGEPRKLLAYFRDKTAVPIMTDGDSILQLGNNAYAKPAVGLNMLRETLLGRDLFDYAFHEYANRWKFKRPQPADFFRTIEDASGADLAWFWRGWFYTSEPADIAITSVTQYSMDTGDPEQKAERDRKEKDAELPSVTQQRNKDLPKRVTAHPELLDFYNDYDEFKVSDEDREKFKKLVGELDDTQRTLLQSAKNFYVLDLANVGGLVMPVILQVTYNDGTTALFRYPAETWRYDNIHVQKLLLSDKKITQFELDPFQETGDIDTDNNAFPEKIRQKRFKVKLKPDEEKNPMQKAIEGEVGKPATQPEVVETPAAKP